MKTLAKGSYIRMKPEHYPMGGANMRNWQCAHGRIVSVSPDGQTARVNWFTSSLMYPECIVRTPIDHIELAGGRVLCFAKAGSP